MTWGLAGVQSGHDGRPTVNDVFLEREAEWRQYAACLGCDPDLWFPPPGSSGSKGHEVAREAKRVCNRCPVQTECAIYALRTKQQHGVWAGMSPKELRRARGQLAPHLAVVA